MKLEEITSLFIGDVHLKDVIISLGIKLRDYEKQGYVRLWTDLEEQSCEYMYNDVVLYGERLENDKEYEKRVKKLEKEAERKKQKKEDTERQEKVRLRQLMKKYPEMINESK